MLTRRVVLAAFACASGLASASPMNWGQFRSPGARGVSDDDPRLPETWSAAAGGISLTEAEASNAAVAWSLPSP
jgi:hypothetical protein